MRSLTIECVLLLKSIEKRAKLAADILLYVCIHTHTHTYTHTHTHTPTHTHVSIGDQEGAEPSAPQQVVQEEQQIDQTLAASVQVSVAAEDSVQEEQQIAQALAASLQVSEGEGEGNEGIDVGASPPGAKVPKVVSERKTLKFCSWLSSLMFLLWILIPLVVPCQVPDSVCGCTEKTRENCGCDENVSTRRDSFNTRENGRCPCSYQCMGIAVYAIIYALLYFIYLVECWYCRTRQYLESAGVNIDDIASYIIEMRHSAPEVVIEVECYHSGGRDDPKVVTFQHREVIRFESIVDSSDFGNMRLSEIKAQIRGWGQQSQEISYNLLAVDSIYEVVYSDPTTEGKIQEIKTSLDNQYSERDKKYESKIVTYKPGLQKYLLLNFGNTSFLTWGGFWVCSYFGLTIPFRLHFERQTAAVKVHITKVVGAMKPRPEREGRWQHPHA